MGDPDGERPELVVPVWDVRGGSFRGGRERRNGDPVQVTEGAMPSDPRLRAALPNCGAAGSVSRSTDYSGSEQSRPRMRYCEPVTACSSTRCPLRMPSIA